MTGTKMLFDVSESRSKEIFSLLNVAVCVITLSGHVTVKEKVPEMLET